MKRPQKAPEPAPPKIVAYYRVSTAQQGASGLGLEGQVAAVQAYAAGQRAEIIKEYREVETGKRADRPELLKALAHARRARATLVIAKLDRLARNVHFLSGLMESKVDFIACDNPHANRLTIHILAAVAEDEARRISERTRAALAAYKARGGKKLGTDNLTAEGRARGARRAGLVARAEANAENVHLAELVAPLRAEGLSLRAIADRLNAAGETTRRGKRWGPAQVLRVLNRADPGRGDFPDFTAEDLAAADAVWAERIARKAAADREAEDRSGPKPTLGTSVYHSGSTYLVTRGPLGRLVGITSAPSPGLPMSEILAQVHNVDPWEEVNAGDVPPDVQAVADEADWPTDLL